MMGRVRKVWDEASDDVHLACADSKTDLQLFECLVRSGTKLPPYEMAMAA
jgi:hypothetical protein